MLQLLLLLLFGRERRRDAAAPFIVEEGGVGLVDLLLFFRRRVWAGDIEVPVLHEIEIGVAAAGLAPPGEFRMALRKLGRLVFLGRRFLGGVGAFLEIGRRAR